MSRLTFEAFTIGTLLIIVAFCTLGYVRARRRDDAGADFTADLRRELLAAEQVGVAGPAPATGRAAAQPGPQSPPGGRT